MRKLSAVAAIILPLYSALYGAGAEDQRQTEPPRVAWMKSISGSVGESVPLRRSRGDGTRDLPRIARGVSTDRHKGVFISGSFLGECTLDGQRRSSAGAADVLVGRLDGDGKVRWFKRFGAGGTDISPDVATDRLGNCVVTGMCSNGAAFDKSTVPTVGGSDAFTAKLDPDGHVLWVRTVGGPRPDCGNEVCTDSDDNILVVGNSYTGTKDRGATGGGPEWKKEPFDLSPAGNKFHVCYEGGHHGSFSGKFARDASSKAIYTHCQAITLAFWNAFLKDDAGAKAWLQSDAAREGSNGLAEISRR
jgi:hypothetical protein